MTQFFLAFWDFELPFFKSKRSHEYAISTSFQHKKYLGEMRVNQSVHLLSEVRAPLFAGQVPWHIVDSDSITIEEPQRLSVSPVAAQ